MDVLVIQDSKSRGFLFLVRLLTTTVAMTMARVKHLGIVNMRLLEGLVDDLQCDNMGLKKIGSHFCRSTFVANVKI